MRPPPAGSSAELKSPQSTWLSAQRGGSRASEPQTHLLGAEGSRVGVAPCAVPPWAVCGAAKGEGARTVVQGCEGDCLTWVHPFGASES